MKTRWVDTISNEHVLKDVNEKRSLLYMTGRRRTKSIGYVIKYNQFLTNIFEGEVIQKTQQMTKISLLRKHGKANGLYNVER